jgi:hypothetical protein
MCRTASCVQVALRVTTPCLRARLKVPLAYPHPQQLHACWHMSVQTCESNILDPMLERARLLLERGVEGGSQNLLKVVTFALEEVNSFDTMRLEAGSTSETQGAAKDDDLTTSPQAARRSMQGNMLLHIVLIYEGDGRLKSSVKRSVQTMLLQNLAEQALPFLHDLVSTLQQQSIHWVLQLVRTSRQHHSLWASGISSDLPEYLVRRIEATTAGFSAQGSAIMAQLGLDILGPPKRLRQPQELQQKRLKGPDAPGPHAQPGVPALAAEPAGGAQASPPSQAAALSALCNLLSTGEDFNEQVASRQATELLKLFHAQFEELALARLQLKFYRDRDALEEQRVSRVKLQSTLRTAVSITDDLVKNLSKQVAAVSDICAPLKPIASTSKPPSLQLMYFGAAAKADGAHSLHAFLHDLLPARVAIW